MNLRDEMKKSGIECDENVVVDGRIHRFRVGNKRAKNGWYVFHQKGDDVFGAFGDWGTGFQSTLGAKTKAIQQELRKVTDRSEARAKVAADVAASEWRCGNSMDATLHPYVLRKKIEPCGARALAGKLLVPMFRGGDLVGLQRITEGGEKRFTPGMKKKGSWFNIPGVGPTVLCEGFATGATIHMATRLPVLVAFDCGNLLAAATDYASAAPVKWIVAADNDQKTVGNPGLTHGFEVAHALGARIAVPIGTTGTDFNDLAADHGLSAVTELIYGAL